MSYLKNNNNKVIVDAILTEYGKQKLAAQGKLGIYKFSVADDEIDYALWNQNNPQGSDYYNSAIVNLPILQALPGAAMNMKYQLFTQNAVVPGLVEEMILTYDSSITASKGAYFDRSYTIQPSIIPPPVDVTKIYYSAYTTTNSDLQGAIFRVDPTINADIGVTADIQKMRDYYASIPGSQYYVGHGFIFRALVPPRTDPIYIDLYVIPHKVSARTKTIKIKLIDIANAEGYNTNPPIIPPITPPITPPDEQQ